jgi:hypothetical protein
MHKNTYTFAHAQDLVMRFERVLLGIEIKIQPGSVLEQLCLNTVDLCEKHERPELRPADSVDIRPSYREMVGLFDLLVKIVSCARHPAFPQLAPHLKLLNAGNPLQSVSTSVLDQDNNKLFELYMAALCLGVPVDDIVLDDPHSSQGDNPDVLAAYQGKRWGLACKALHSAAPKTIMDNIRKAVDQIERSPADTGLPVLSAKNIIAHDEIWPMSPESSLTGTPGDALIFFSFPAIQQPAGMLNAYANRIRDQLLQEFGPEELLSAFDGRRAKPACLVYLPSATSILRDELPVLARLNVLTIIPFGNVDEPTMQFIGALHYRLQLSDA